MKHTRQQIIDMSNRSHSHADALATLYEMIAEEYASKRKIRRDKIRASVDMTMKEHGCMRPLEDEYALAEAVFAAAGWTIVDDDPEPMQGWQPIETAPKDGSHIFLKRFGWPAFQCRYITYGERHRWIKSDDQNGIPYTPTHWMPIPPLPENDK